MINHLFKLIWKKRGSNFLIMLEVFVAFLILFAVSSASVFFYGNYIKPSGINPDNVWVVYVDFNSNNDSLNRLSRDLLRQKVKTYREIKAFSFGTHFPYGNSTSNRGFNYNGKEINAETMGVEDTYPAVLGLKMESGTWFQDRDTIQKESRIVITQHLKEEMFGSEDAIGKTTGKDYAAKIVGVIPNFKFENDFQGNDNCIFSASNYTLSSFILKIDPEVSAEFEAKFAKSLQGLGKDWTIKISHLDEMKKDKNQLVIIPLTMAFIVSGFLILNVAFGLFGVLFQNIHRRRGEIGLRRAVGASATQISTQFIGEMLVLATFSITLGLFFAIQFPILKVFDVNPSVYLMGILWAVLAIYGIVILCAWFPSRQAAKIHPATALHED